MTNPFEAQFNQEVCLPNYLSLIIYEIQLLELVLISTN